jgi:FAD:protein FMN transferase
MRRRKLFLLSILVTLACSFGQATSHSTFAGPSKDQGLDRESQLIRNKTADYTFSREGVLGSSYELIVRTTAKAKGEAAQARVMKEFEARKALVNTYNTSSEISKINALAFQDGEQIVLSYSLYLLLRDCAKLQKRTNGAFNAFLGEPLAIWKKAMKAGGPIPTKAEISKSIAIANKGFKVSKKKKGVYVLTRYAPGQFQLDAIGKGYILDKAARDAMEDVKGLSGLMINVGGDIIVGGKESWEIGVSNPKEIADNAAPLTRVRLKNSMAIATSGGYERSAKVGKKTYNHIMDPRTGQPVDGVLSATVIAPTARKADAWATALCVLSPKEGIKLLEKYSDGVCLIVDKAGKQHRSRGFQAFEIASEIKAPSPELAWPENHHVLVQFTLINSWKTVNKPRKRSSFKRHFVAAWVETEGGRRVRLLAVWAEGGEMQYIRDLDDFWKYAWILAGEANKPSLLKRRSRATRAPGRYRLQWDGLDDNGKAVPKGRYVICLDVNRENGPPNRREGHTSIAVPIDCGDKPSSVTSKDQPELGGVKVVYQAKK